MKVGKKGLKMSDGSIRHFGSEQKRDNFERVAEAVKHGFKPDHAGHRASHSASAKTRRK